MSETKTDRLCRTCMNDSNSHSPIYRELCLEDSILFEVINDVCQLEVTEGDGLPEYVCHDCLAKLSEFHKFKCRAHEVNVALLRLKVKVEPEDSFDEASNGREDTPYEEYIGIEPCDDDMPPLKLEDSDAKEETVDVECDTEDMGGVSRCSGSEMIALDKHHGGIKMEQVEEPNEGEFSEEYGDEDGRAEFETPRKASPGLLSPKMTVSSVPDCLAVSGEINSEAEWHNQEHNVVDVHSVKGSLEMWNLKRIEMPMIQKESNDKANKEHAVIANGGCDNNEENREECRIKETNLYKGRLRNKMRNINENLADQYRKPYGKDCRRKSTKNISQNKPLGLKNPGDSIACSASQKAMKVKNIAKKTLDKPVFISKGTNSLRNRNRNELQHFYCDTCKKGFRTKYHLGRHVRIHNGVRPYQCSLCSKSFSRRDHLRLHISVHTVGKPHVCTECGKSFKQERYLRMHNKIHRDHYPFPCVTCGKLFKSLITFQEHFKIHGIVKPFTCKICSKNFSSKGILVQHQKTHEDNRKKPFSCDTCKKSFIKKHSLEDHIYSHDSFKRHKCSICAKSFSLKHTLKRHMSCHSTERHFKCPNCSQCFNRMDTLRHHMKFVCSKM